VREALIELAGRYPGVTMVVDSRMRIGEYRRIILKPNEREAARAIDPKVAGEISWLLQKPRGEPCTAHGRPVYVTVGDKGTLCARTKAASASLRCG